MGMGRGLGRDDVLAPAAPHRPRWRAAAAVSLVLGAAGLTGVSAAATSAPSAPTGPVVVSSTPFPGLITRAGEATATLHLLPGGGPAARAWAAAHGLRSAAVGGDDTALHVFGAPGTLGTLFGAAGLSDSTDALTGLLSVTRDLGRALRVPAGLAGAVSDVQGLDTRAGAQPQSVDALTPTDLQAAYGGPRNGSSGAGVTIAIAGLEPWDPQDVIKWAAQEGVPLASGQLGTVNINTTSPVVSAPNGSSEVATDVEAALSAAPQATIRVYEITNDGTGLSKFASVMKSEADQGVIQVASVSFSACEGQYPKANIDADTANYAAAEADGVTVVAASGDYGLYGCANPASAGDSMNSSPKVDYPAALAPVVAVGGTNLVSTLFEVGWGTVDPNAGGFKGLASGGGESATVARPAWQAAIGVGHPGRLVPDLALAADANHGLDAFSANLGGRVTIGGTSVSSPLFAGFLAGVISSSATRAPLGDIHARLYAHPEAFRDITQGSNGAAATVGWDMVTGLGSPRMDLLAKVLAPNPATDGTGGKGWTAALGGSCSSNCNILVLPTTGTGSSGHSTPATPKTKTHITTVKVVADDARAMHAGHWTTKRQTGAKNGHISSSAVKGSAIAFRFTGNHAVVTFWCSSTAGGVMMKIDGRKLAPLNLYCRGKGHPVTGTLPNLNPTVAHLLQVSVLGVRPPGSSGMTVAVDSLSYSKQLVS